MAILTTFRHRFWNNDGTLASGGKVYVYEPGTTTLKNSWTDSTQASANTNPVILDSKGEADIWTSGLCKINVLQSDNVQVTGYPVDMLGGGGGRELLTAARTYYVATTGSDSNTGLTVGAPFLTIQKAVDVVCSLDMSTYQVTIQVADGTYTSGAVLKQYIGALQPIVQGNTTTPANCIVSVTSSNCFYVAVPFAWTVLGFKLQTTTSGRGLLIDSGKISYGYIDFAGCVSAHIDAINNGTARAIANYTISGASLAHWQPTEGGIINTTGITITITGTPAFGVAFLYSRNNGICTPSNSTTFIGSATGVRYNISLNSTCYVNGSASTYLPGNSAGTTGTGGQYS